MNTALVTGATGMLGSYMAQHLIQGGWMVRALVRNPVTAGGLKEMGGQLAVGDLSDAESVRSAAAGCDLVFHSAAAIGAGGDWESFRRGNVEGTRNVIDAAAEAHARLVHVSSTSVFGRERYFDEPTDEWSPLPDLPAWDVYGRSKQDAEELVFEARQRGRIWATVVRPPVMYGRWDRQFLPRIGPVLDKGFFPLVRGGRSVMTLVHAGAVADGAILAGQNEVANGQVYHFTNDFDVTVEALVRHAAEGLGRRIRSPSVPISVARMGFRALACGLVMVGRKNLSRHAVGTLEMVSRDNPFTSRRARSELGWAPKTHPAQGLPEAFRWWKAQEAGPPGQGGGRHANA